MSELDKFIKFNAPLMIIVLFLMVCALVKYIFMGW